MHNLLLMKQISFKQYNPSKPGRYGVLYESINAALIPYTFITAVYTRKPVGEPDEFYLKGTSAVVKSLVNMLSDSVDLHGCIITTDRLYTSL